MKTINKKTGIKHYQILDHNTGDCITIPEGKVKLIFEDIKSLKIGEKLFFEIERTS